MWWRRRARRTLRQPPGLAAILPRLGTEGLREPRASLPRSPRGAAGPGLTFAFDGSSRPCLMLLTDNGQGERMSILCQALTDTRRG